MGLCPIYKCKKLLTKTKLIRNKQYFYKEFIKSEKLNLTYRINNTRFNYTITRIVWICIYIYFL